MKAKVKSKNYGLWLVAFGFWLVAVNGVNNSVFASTPVLLNQRNAVKDGLSSTCSEQSLEKLTTQLLQDLPSYANRVTQRARRRSRSSDIYSYLLVAGKPEFQPLPINTGVHNADGQKSTATGVEQVFFTTLERQYIAGKIVESQQFHWLLLTKSNTGWRLVMMFTQIGAYPQQQQVISPPRDSSKGVIAQAVKTWLRDCQAGSVRMPSGI
ncbi:hypothetical protein [Nodularia sp. NIES-3585]|uniref:hypothetical protein n=1 Tax=Nodularia sp. NIES-3585 TaxID=1973477 RepID=UPI000B7183C6|nr:hypothetical protein [Nodularia sp. NIES-3585]GAX38197.1 hypothetical protein NIES3585_42450 [Nodularia sp. NIES-3585]